VSAAATRGSARRSLRRFVKTPKGYLLLLFAGLLAIACTSPAHGGWLNLEAAAVGAASAAVVDVVLVMVRRDEWIFPSGALLSGLIVAMVLSAYEPLTVIAATAAIASASKHIFRIRAWNVFNPAALAIVVSSLAFHTGQSWWGSLPQLGPGGVGGVAVVAVAGLLIANHINKLPLVLTFLASYFLLFTIASYSVGATNVAEIFRSPDTNAVLFFAVFMLDDPPTCPTRYIDQVVYGVVVAASSYAFFMQLGVVYYLLAGVLIGNGWESFRRGLALMTRRTARA
jgi:Na+-translocating ferredoxin:NAD+ oxidoreductase RnfD subunit